MLYGRSYHRHQQLLHVWVTETIIVTYHVSLPHSMLLSPIVSILNSFQDFSFSICWGNLKTIRFGDDISTSSIKHLWEFKCYIMGRMVTSNSLIEV